jgi:uncharacterized membrane protein YkvA (DUF1232 family)
MSDDPFPRERVRATLRRLPAYLRLAWRLARDPLLSRARRAAVVAAAGYLASPIDAVPGVIPVVGQLDDIAVALAALRFALAGLDADRRREHLGAVGLEDGDLAEDLRTVGAASAWLVRAGARTGYRTAKGGARVVATGAHAAGRAAPAVRAAVGRAAQATSQVADRAAPAAREAVANAAPAARRAAVRVAPAAREAALRGLGGVLGRVRRTSQPEVTVRPAPRPALGPGTGPRPRDPDGTPDDRSNPG